MKKIDLFKPIVPRAKWHPNFKSFMHDAYTDSRDVLTEWASDFPDRDGKFVIEFQTTFNSSFWELYLHACFRGMSIPVDYSHQSPDYLLKSVYGDVIVEASTTNHPLGEDAEWDSLKLFEKIKTRPLSGVVDLASIRLVNTITAKHKYYVSSYASLPYVAGKPFVLAIAPFEQPHFFAQNSEAIHRVLYGFRARRVLRDGVVETDIFRESHMAKPNGAHIPLGLFADASMKQISAVIFSTTATTGKVRALSRDSGTMLFGVVRYRKHALTPSYEVFEKAEYNESLLDGLAVYHNPFATHELDPRVFFEKGVSQHWYDPQSGLPSDNTEDGSLIQRFCIKLLTKGKNVSKTSLGKTKEILKNIEPKPKPSK